ncbi:MAG: hypothetical protein JO100_17950 [Pseudonocardia sp.]|nr:hypothetical protein [Pseudonocardia sp.]
MGRLERDITEGLLEWLRRRNDCQLDPGLTQDELDHAQRVLGLTVPPQWRAVLRQAHPVMKRGAGVRYPDWRSPEDPATRALVAAPVEGVLFDVAENGFWWYGWGPVPDTAERRLELARDRLAALPRLTPLMGHCYVADSDDSPVFSIVQGDLYVPALTLADLPAGRGQDGISEDEYPIGSVPFWSELHAYSQLGHSERGQARFGMLARGGA